MIFNVLDFIINQYRCLFMLFEHFIMQQYQAVTMENLTKIQKQLLLDVPEFQKKTQIIEYYVGFEFPERQRKMLNWWSNMIDLAIRKSDQIYLSPASLQTIFTIHGLKPIPISNILAYLSQKQIILWRNKPKVEQKSVISSMLGYFWKQQNGRPSIGSDVSSQIVSTKYMDQLISQTKKIIQQIERVSDKKTIEYQYLEQQLKKRLKISYRSIKYLLQELENLSAIKIGKHQDQKIVYYSKSTKELSNSQWVQVQNSKHSLKKQIQDFDRKLQILQKQQRKLIEQAKQILLLNSANCKQKARKILQPVKNRQKSIQGIRNRKKLLQQTYYQLESQQITQITVDIMNNCQQVLTKTKRDASELDQINEKNRQIKYQQSQNEDRFKNMNEEQNEQLNEDIDALMGQLQNQVQAEKTNKISGQAEKVQIRTLKTAKQYDKEKRKKNVQNSREINYA